MLLDLLIDILLQSFCEGFLALHRAFFPKRELSPTWQWIFAIALAILACALLAGLVFGLLALIETDGKSTVAWILVGLAVAYLVSGIVLTLIFRGKKKP